MLYRFGIYLEMDFQTLLIMNTNIDRIYPSLYIGIIHLGNQNVVYVEYIQLDMKILLTIYIIIYTAFI
jgi:hypothetical protein